RRRRAEADRVRLREAAPVTRALLGLAHERLHRADPAERLLAHDARLGERVLMGLRELLEAEAEEHGRRDHRRDREEHDARQARVHREEDRERAYEDERL